ncbi:MAG: PspC domain-containing protein [Candidatus Curtissbacteria bacterium]
MKNKKFYRSKTNKVFAGVMGGAGEYFGVDPTILRLVFVILVIFTGFFPGVLLYIISIFIIPQK